MPQLVTEKPQLHYIANFSEPVHHLIDVELRIPSHPQEERLELVFPVWTPGSYMVREYTRNIEAISATGQDRRGQAAAQPLSLARIGKNRWQVVDAH
ncbi:MAG: hypothetical protein KDA45_06345, partial [Planctomycetales bacterium]|nr:hypothetical protein [Planctomycetales bacterium]